MKKLKLAYIGGGSRNWARKLMNDLALEKSLAGSVYLYDIDYDSALDNARLGNMISEHKGSVSKWNYIAVDNIDDALKGADVVVISILPGSFNEMMVDVHTPEKFGVYQTVGDTAGFGGYMRAMRCAPAYELFGKKIKENCPDALVVNYTNPMTLCSAMLLAQFPEMKLIGCCHEVFGTQELLACVAAESFKIERPSREEIKVDVTGINHFTWITGATYKGEDLFPHFKKFAEKYKETGFYVPIEEEVTEYTKLFKYGNIIKFKSFEKYGVIPAAGDRHLAEFFPGKWFLDSLEMASKNMFRLTPVKMRMESLAKVGNETQKLLSGEKPLVIEASGEEGVKQIKAFMGGGDFTTNVNTANKGQIERYPLGAVVETNATISAGDIKPIKTSPLPYEVDALILRHVYHHKAFIEAMRKKDANAVKYIIADDPQNGKLDLEQIDVLFDEMFEGTRKYLDGYWIK